MLQQLTDEERIKQADYVVDNNPNSPLLQQVLELHQKDSIRLIASAPDHARVPSLASRRIASNFTP